MVLPAGDRDARAGGPGEAAGTPRTVYLQAPRYVLGETEVDHAAIPGFYERAREFGMVPEPQVWGWGRARRTARSLEALAVEVARDTLRAAALPAHEVDALLLCSTRFPGDADSHGAFLERILTGTGLGHAAVTGVTLGRCANFLAGIRLASQLVAAGAHRCVLVVTTDRIEDEATRVKSFALFSDGAASCLVSSEPAGDAVHEIVSCASAQDHRAFDWRSGISADLAREVSDAVLRPASLELADVAGLMHNNIYKAVVVAKERQAGFAPGQLFTGNIARVGHCFAADPLVNLVDRTAAGAVEEGRHYLLASSVPGLRIGVLLRTVKAAVTS